ncbi:zwei Ig domain protein zig-8-like isoform X3 [Mercenaria mercenaria]|uniref:zwei Ig domain protein zig-8-like isoform X3 n=1 Tax=Mercenaria mercenaria TaxID=6596 RepID=UPI001E1DB78E|nr:zwei Ig domain protein zig-8-like isoform X3 [Mercenaria mercenaria]
MTSKRNNNLLQCVILSVIVTNVLAYNLSQSTPAPEFLPAPFNVSFHVGDLAMLSCGINNLGTKTVVWRRLDSSFPLTSGKMTVIDDKRLQVSHVVHKNQWDLMIKDVKLEDDGIYECQISSKDRTVRRLVTLHVVEPKVEIPEINITEPQYVERGETIKLQCNATGEHYPPEEMDWFRNGQKISSQRRKGIHISKQFSIIKRKFTSVLTIDRAEMTDDGTYVCRSSNMQITSTKVIVLNAETSPIKRGTIGDKPIDKGSYTSRSAAARIPRTFLLNTVLLFVILTLRALPLYPS